MNVIGIIAEYNPFHYGHRYHLQEARKKAKADGVLCVLSGNFLQRGEPALCDKWARAQMALSQGVDLVFELPALYATRSAYWFARGGIEILTKTGIVSHLAFGIESSTPSPLFAIAQLLAEEPESYRVRLKHALRKGLSFPQARAQALPPELTHQQQLLRSPNNILALTYLQVLREQNSSLIPLPITRKGAGYLDTALKKETLPSATAIRKYFTEHSTDFKAALSALKEYLPETTLKILEEQYLAGKAPVSWSALAPPLLTLLRRTTQNELRQIIEVSEGLENRIFKIAQQVTSLEDFLLCLKTKRYPATRLQRFLIHLLLNYTKEEEKCLSNGVPYLHLLGYTSRGQQLLQEIKKRSTLPLITKGAHIKKYLPNNAVLQSFWDFEIRATNLYSPLYPRPSVRLGNLDYRQNPVKPLDI